MPRTKGIEALTRYEILSVVIACIAAFISIYVWVGQRRLQREANDLQRATDALAKKQLEMLEGEEASKSKAQLSLTLERQGGSNFRFRLRNVGAAEARNVAIALVLDDPADNPIIASDYTEKFPIKRFPPGSSISLIAALHMGTPTAYNAVLKWTDPDGTAREEGAFVAL